MRTGSDTSFSFHTGTEVCVWHVYNSGRQNNEVEKEFRILLQMSLAIRLTLQAI